MRLPTNEEQKRIRDLNARIRADFAKAAPVMAATMRDIVLAFMRFRDAMAKLPVHK